ncbi:hypothetical protein ATW7_15431 [Alteromonadales bacterium TW-7]|nr:hypothetical protein ATW7_15431 [Alteromonadales bacterium TW-7]
MSPTSYQAAHPALNMYTYYVLHTRGVIYNGAERIDDDFGMSDELQLLHPAPVILKTFRNIYEPALKRALLYRNKLIMQGFNYLKLFK